MSPWFRFHHGIQNEEALTAHLCDVKDTTLASSNITQIEKSLLLLPARVAQLRRDLWFMSSSFSPGQSPGSSRLLQLGAAGSASRLRSSSSKKPPEPLRRAVADCLSSSPPPVNSHHGAIPSMAPSEALRNLRVCNTYAMRGLFSLLWNGIISRLCVSIFCV